MKLTTRQLALCAVLTALALGLSYMEGLFPVSLLIPLPGIKLGLANIVTVYALYELGVWPALAILTARCLLGSVFAGNASALIFSLMGGVLQVIWLIMDIFIYAPFVIASNLLQENEEKGDGSNDEG